jgi:hypothetical protein
VELRDALRGDAKRFTQRTQRAFAEVVRDDHPSLARRERFDGTADAFAFRTRDEDRLRVAGGVRLEAFAGRERCVELGVGRT